MAEINDILQQPLPFYSSEAEQAFYTKIHLGSPNYIHNVTSTLRLIPFTLTRDELAQAPTHVYLVDLQGTETDILSNIDATELIYYSTSSGTDYILYFGNVDLTSAMTEGCYHLKITDDTNTWYSDKFIVSDSIDYIEFEYYNKKDDFGFLYNGGQGVGFKNRLRIVSPILKSFEWEEYEEVEENRELDPFVIYKKKTKIYTAFSILWDYTMDALQVMDLHDNISVIKTSGDESELINIESLTPEIIEKTDYAEVQIKFKLRNIIREPVENLSITSVGGTTYRELREDGGYELREDGSYELREF